VEAQQWFWSWGWMESFRAGNYLLDESDLQAAMLVFALLGWKWRLEVKARQWF
jgi:hypothetical protein